MKYVIKNKSPITVDQYGSRVRWSTSGRSTCSRELKDS